MLNREMSLLQAARRSIKIDQRQNFQFSDVGNCFWKAPLWKARVSSVGANIINFVQQHVPRGAISDLYLQLYFSSKMRIMTVEDCCKKKEKKTLCFVSTWSLVHKIRLKLCTTLYVGIRKNYIQQKQEALSLV